MAAYPKSTIRCRFRCPVSIFKTPESSSRRALRGGQIGGLRRPSERQIWRPRRALRERDLRLRARVEAPEALREPDLRLREPDPRPQRRSGSQI